MSKITLEFDTDAQAEAFANWLCGQGEQDYWLWAEHQDDLENYCQKIDYRAHEDKDAFYGKKIKFTRPME